MPKLFQSLDRLDRPCDAETHVCILLDGCTDASDALAASFRVRSVHRVWIEQGARSCANAGRARHQAMMMGSRALGGGEGLLLTTDADSMPAAGWLTAMATGLDRADVVLGKVVRAGDRPNPLQDRVEFYYEKLVALRRRLDPLPWEAARVHHHASGANMGFRAGAYRALGGFASVVSGEDALLADDAARAGMRVRRDAGSVVVTSDRREGRATGGMAIALQQLDGGDPATVRVAHPEDAAWQYRLQQVARAAHGDGRLHLVAASIGLSEDHVEGVARDCPNAEAFAMRIVPTPPGGMRHVALPIAEAELAKLLDAREAA